jgi:hypothetical protein
MAVSAAACRCVQELFAAYDKDKSGTISFEELADGLRGQGYVVNESEVGRSFTQSIRCVSSKSGQPKRWSTFKPPVAQLHTQTSQVAVVRMHGVCDVCSDMWCN